MVEYHYSDSLFYFFPKRAVKTNATWYALTEDALSNHSKAREQWTTRAQELLFGGIKKVKGAIAVISPIGPTIFLPNRFASEICNMKELNFGQSVLNISMASYKGLTPIQAIDYHNIIQEVIRLDLTRSLDSVSGEMSEEAGEALQEMLGNIPDWKTMELKPFLHRLIARLSTRVFLGPELSNNKEWLDIAIAYVNKVGMAIKKLRAMHPLLRPLAQWWLPELRACRQQVARSQKLIAPLVEDRLRRKSNGQITEKTADMLSWFDDRAKKKGVKIDVAEFQLLLVIVAVNTTVETMAMLVADLVENKEEIPRLREEMISALSANDWSCKKTSLVSMELLDSAMKESQRINPLSNFLLQRIALTNVTLSDGTIIPKGYRVGVEHRYQDPTLYPNPDKFDIDRFVKLRDTNRNKWHFVTSSPEHLGFGYGKHMCPGQFLASNQMKIALIHMLLKYDWKFPEGEGRISTRTAGTDRYCDPRQKIMVKSRQEATDLGLP